MSKQKGKGIGVLLRNLYWAISGSLVGVGLIAFGLGLLPTLLGTVLAIYGLRTLGREGFWITIAFMGACPASVLIFIYVTRDPSSTYFGPEDWYAKGVGLFVLIMLVGLAWGVIEARRGGPARSG
jgi:hypothetical protein